MFSERLKSLRSINNITQKQLSEVIDITERSYRRYENGTSTSCYHQLLRLSDYFNVSIDYLVGRTDNPKVNKVEVEKMDYLSKMKFEAEELLEQLKRISNTDEQEDYCEEPQKTYSVILIKSYEDGEYRRDGDVPMLIWDNLTYEMAVDKVKIFRKFIVENGL